MQRRQFLGAAAALSALPVTNDGTPNVGAADEEKELRVPVQNRETLEVERGAHVRAEVFDAGTCVEVMGSMYPDGGPPVVHLSIEGEGIAKNYAGFVFSPDEARKLAEKLRDHAAYAERYTHRRREEKIAEGEGGDD